MGKLSVWIAVAAAVIPAAVWAELCLPVQSGADLLKQRGLSMDGKVVVLTGGTSGIGYGIATAVASAGAKLYLLGYHADSAAAAAANITADTGNHDIHVIAPFDLSSFQSIDAAVAQLGKLAPRIDVLICDAGLDSEHDNMPRVTTDGYEITFQVTFLGHFKLTEALLPSLRAAKGRVVNTGSVTSMVTNLTSSLAEFPEGTTCAQQGLKEGCLAIDFLKTALTKPAPPAPMGLNATFADLAHVFKTFYGYEFSAREAANGVVMYTGHPGGVLTPQAKAEGLNNRTLVAEVCTPLAWSYCCCVSDPSLKFDPDNCLLTPERGSAANAWLAAAPRETIEAGTTEKFFALCTPLGGLSNQYTAYAEAQTGAAAAQYARDLTTLWTGWVQ